MPRLSSMPAQFEDEDLFENGWLLYECGKEKLYAEIGRLTSQVNWLKYPNLSKRDLALKIFPYLLRGVETSYLNHVWGLDITYIWLKELATY